MAVWVWFTLHTSPEFDTITYCSNLTRHTYNGSAPKLTMGEFVLLSEQKYILVLPEL